MLSIALLVLVIVKYTKPSSMYTNYWHLDATYNKRISFCIGKHFISVDCMHTALSNHHLGSLHSFSPVDLAEKSGEPGKNSKKANFGSIKK